MSSTNDSSPVCLGPIFVSYFVREMGASHLSPGASLLTRLGQFKGLQRRATVKSYVKALPAPPPPPPPTVINSPDRSLPDIGI